MSGQPAVVAQQRPFAARVLSKLGLAVFTIALSVGVVGVGIFVGRQVMRGQWVPLVAATGLATYIVIALVNARHALLFWIATAPFARFIHLDVELGRGIPNLTLNRVMTGVLVMLVLAQIATGRRRAARPMWSDLFLVLFAGAIALSVPGAQQGLRSAAQFYFDLIVVPVAVYMVARHLTTSYGEFRNVVVVLIIVGLYMAVLAAHEQITGDIWFYPEDRSIQYTRSLRRVVALLGNPAYLAATIDMAIPWAWLYFLRARRRRLMALLCVATLSAGVYLCMNRSGWVGLVAGLIALAALNRRFRPYFVAILLVGAILLSVFWALVIASPAVRERLSAQGPIVYRQGAWQVAYRMISSNPLLGIGFENYQPFYRRYAQYDTYFRVDPSPHSTPLWIVLTGGLAALLPFVLFVGGVASSAWRALHRPLTLSDGQSEQDLAGAFLACMVSIVVPSMTMDTFYGYYTSIVLFCVIGSFLGATNGEHARANQSAPPSRRRDVALQAQRLAQLLGVVEPPSQDLEPAP